MSSGAAAAQDKPAAAASPQICPARCYDSAGRLSLSPAAARACLSDEAKAAALPDALAAQRAALAKAQSLTGALDESRLVLKSTERRLADCGAELAVTRAELDNARRARWYWGAAGAASTVAIVLVIVFAAR